MTRTELHYIKDNRLWPVDWLDRIPHLVFTFMPLGISFIGFIMLLGLVRFGIDHYNIQYILTAIIVFLLGIVLALLITRQFYNERRFREMPLSDISLIDLPDQIEKIGWKNIEIQQLEVMECTAKMTAFSWGESITIVKINDNLILFNCRSIGIQPFTLRKDIVNFNKLNKILKSHTASHAATLNKSNV